MTHPDDSVRIVIEEKNYARPMYLCSDCILGIQQCRLCRWFKEELKKCFESPYSVTKSPNDGCSRWKQDEPIYVSENDREEVANGSPKFALA